MRPSRDLEPVALDRVREDDRRPVRSSGAPAGARRGCRRDRGRRGRGRAARPRRGSRRAGARAAAARPRRGRSSNVSRTTSSLAPNSDWYCSFGISSIRRRSSSPPSCCTRRAQAAAVLELDHLPAARAEVRLELGGADPGDHAVERLPVQVDDPEHVPEPARQRLRERLPDVPLVELGVAEQRDEAAAGRGAEPRLA